MAVSFKSILTFFLIFFIASCWAARDQSPWFYKGKDNHLKLKVELFLSSNCSHCQQASAFFETLQVQKPWLQVNRYVINQDKKALDYFHEKLNQIKSDDYSVPAVFFCNSRWIGFDKPETTGNVLLKSLDYCYQQISQKGELNRSTQTVLKQWANASFFASGLINKPNAAVIIPMTALIDALNSCSIFVALALFSFLWLYRLKSTMLGLGAVFLVIMVAVHHFQQDHTVFFYYVLQRLRIPSALIGLGLIAYVFKIYSKKTEDHPNIFILILVGLTALVIEAYQQMCMPNFSLIFTQWLDLQPISALRREAYLFLYNLFYLLPLVLFTGLLIYCRVGRKLESIKLFLIFTAWCLLLIIGVLLVVYPKGLADFFISVAVLFVSLIAAWLSVRRKHGLRYHHR